MSLPTATLVVVTYRTRALDLDWVDPDAHVVVVHNDGELDRRTISHPRVDHVVSPGNIGFGAAVNRVLPRCATTRLVVANPDLHLCREHWDALCAGSEQELVTLRLADADSRPTITVSAYPGPLTHLISGYRIGRLAPRGGALRHITLPALGRFGRSHREGLALTVGSWSLAQRWCAGTVFSIDLARLRSIGGFDPGYFLYYEDVDLCRRLALRYPDAMVRVAETHPGVHLVGASDPQRDLTTSLAEQHRLRSAIRYARAHSGRTWAACAALLQWRARRVGVVQVAPTAS